MHKISSSIPTPPILLRNSTTVTSEPRRLHTLPISSPIIPPPTTTNFPGTFWNESALVEPTICSSSSSMAPPGNGRNLGPGSGDHVLRSHGGLATLVELYQD